MKLFAPAYPNEDAFFCRFFTEVSSLRDAAGRPLHEVDFREGGEAYTSCPFHDSRRGYLMNKAALTQITGEWEQILEGVRFYTSLFEGSGTPDLSRAWRISLASMFAPLYLIHSAKRPFADGTLPTPVSGVFKIMLDVPTTMDLMLLSGWREGIAHASTAGVALQIQEYADRSGILLNGEYACAGSPGLIERVVGMLFEEKSIGGGEFANYFGDTQEFLAFCYLMSRQYIVGLVYLLSTTVAMERAFAELDEGVETGEERIAAYERRRRIALVSLQGTGNAEGALRGIFDQIRDERRWNPGSEMRIEGDQVLEASLELLSLAMHADAREISAAHCGFERTVMAELNRLQSATAGLIDAKTMFVEPITLGDPRRSPVWALKARLQ